MESLALNDSVLYVWAALNLIILAWLIGLSAAVWRLYRARKRLADRTGQFDVQATLSQSLAAVDNLAAEHQDLRAAAGQDRGLLQRKVGHVGVVRYDAFADVGGRLSFSAALLNDKGDGLVLTSISGRDSSRVYAKPISEKASQYSLSEEEVEAINQALKNPGDPK